MKKEMKMKMKMEEKNENEERKASFSFGSHCFDTFSVDFILKDMLRKG